MVASTSGAACAIFIAVSRVEARRFTLFDDAMVSMTYARTMAEGYGMIWQPGAEPVQGYTNLAWMSLMAALHRLGLDAGAASVAVMVASAGLIVGCALLAMSLAARLAPGELTAQILAGLLTGLFPPLLFWALRGMEVGLFSFLALALVLIAVRLRTEPSAWQTALAGLVLTVGLLARSDYVVVAGVVVGWLAIAGSRRVRMQVVPPLAAAVVLVLGLTTWFQAWYYGSALPNTYHLKLVGTPLADRIGRGMLVLLFQLVAGLGILLVLTALAWARGGRRPELALLLAVAASTIGYAIYVGGDAWEWTGLADRYLVPAFLVLIVSASAGVQPAVRAIRRTTHRVRVMAAVVAVAVFWGFAGQAVLLAGGLPGEWLQLEDPYELRSIPIGIGITGALVFVVVRIIGDGPAGTSVRTGSAVVSVALLLALSGPALVNWTARGVPSVAADGSAARYGEVLRDLTTDDATVAVAWGGAPPYYSGRTSIDLLGKSDAVVARGSPHLGIPLYPGHNKWDYDHSIGNLRPDLIAQLPIRSAREAYGRAIEEGYVRVRPIDASARAVAEETPWSQVILARAGSPNVRWERLEIVR